MYPRVANLQAVFTAVGAGFYFMDLIEMCAVHTKKLVRLNVKMVSGDILTGLHFDFKPGGLSFTPESEARIGRFRQAQAGGVNRFIFR